MMGRWNSGNGEMAVLAQIFGLLNASIDLKDHLEEMLPLVATSLAVPGIALYMKRFSGRKPFTLECLAAFTQAHSDPAHVSIPGDQFPSDILTSEQWSALESREVVRIPGCIFLLLQEVRVTFLAPFFLGRSLFGILEVACADEECCLGSRKFIENVCYALGFFFARLNAEKRLNDFLDFVPHPIMTVDDSGVITGWSKASEAMTGWKRHDLLGLGNYMQGLAYYGMRRPTIPDLILRPDPEWEATYPEFRREGDKIYSLSYCPAVVGGGAYLRTKTSLLYDFNGRVCGDIHMVEDMTRELEMKENLHRSESMYRAITDFAGVGIMVLTKDSIIYYNEHFAELLKDAGSGERISLEVLRTWINPDDRDMVFGYFSDLFESPGNVDRFEFSAKRGKLIRYYKGYAQLMEYEGTPALHFIADDITPQRELAQKARLNELRMQHEDRLAALGVMAAGIAHELNQPLNHIRMIADGILMSREKGWDLRDQDVEKNLSMISRQVVRMSQIVQNIRNFSKKERFNTPAIITLNGAVENVFCMIGRQLKRTVSEWRKSWILANQRYVWRTTNWNRLFSISSSMPVRRSTRPGMKKAPAYRHWNQGKRSVH